MELHPKLLLYHNAVGSPSAGNEVSLLTICHKQHQSTEGLEAALIAAAVWGGVLF